MALKPISVTVKGSVFQSMTKPVITYETEVEDNIDMINFFR